MQLYLFGAEEEKAILDKAKQVCQILFENAPGIEEANHPFYKDKIQHIRDWLYSQDMAKPIGDLAIDYDYWMDELERKLELVDEP